MNNPLIIHILDYIDKHLYVKITMDDLSNYFHYNKDYIMRLFKKELHLTIFQYINCKKIYLSLEGLQYSDYSILNVALSYGFSSQEYYSEIFKKIIGVNPTIYRKFIHYDRNIPIDTFHIINDHLVYLKNTLDYIDQYRIIIVKKTILKLSIFKEKKSL